MNKIHINFNKSVLGKRFLKDQLVNPLYDFDELKNRYELIECFKNNEINFNVDPIIKDRLIHGYDDIEITLKNKQLIVDYENNKNKFHIWKNIVNEKQ